MRLNKAQLKELKKKIGKRSKETTIIKKAVVNPEIKKNVCIWNFDKCELVKYNNTYCIIVSNTTYSGIKSEENLFFILYNYNVIRVSGSQLKKI